MADSLLDWYDREGRSLPWRKTKDPYKIWLSETMLQQTQVKTVIPYYTRWLETFPSITSVAEASLDEVLKKWEGLGYYSRCRNFHRAARLVQSEYHGNIPLRDDLFRDLPGIGSYTANMVLSIVARCPRPAIDGNLRRIGFRLLGLKSDSRHNQKRIENYFKSQMDRNRPGDFNQAFMDLGSRICRPRSANCHQCPVKLFCRAADRKQPLDYPALKVSKPIPHHHFAAGFIWARDKFLVRKRTEKLLHGMWELPTISMGNTSNVGPVKNAMEDFTGYRLKKETPAGSVFHRYTHFSLTITLFYFELDQPREATALSHQKWITGDEVQQYAFHKAAHKLFSLTDMVPKHHA